MSTTRTATAEIAEALENEAEDAVSTGFQHETSVRLSLKRFRKLLRDAAAALRALEAEISDPGTTHAVGCYTWGPKHWVCALGRILALEAENARLDSELNGANEAWAQLSSDKARLTADLAEAQAENAEQRERLVAAEEYINLCEPALRGGKEEG